MAPTKYAVAAARSSGYRTYPIWWWKLFLIRKIDFILLAPPAFDAAFKCSYFPFWALAQPFNWPDWIRWSFSITDIYIFIQYFLREFLIKRIIYRGAPRPVRFYVYSFHSVRNSHLHNTHIQIHPHCSFRRGSFSIRELLFHALHEVIMETANFIVSKYNELSAIVFFFNFHQTPNIPTFQPPTARYRNTFVRIAMHCNVFIELIKIGCRFIQCRK